MRKRLLAILLCGMSPLFSHAATVGDHPSLPTPLPSDAEAQVVVFLSARCPCSASHTSEVQSLQKEFPKLNFLLIHSNADETPEEVRAFFDPRKIQILDDVDGKWAQALGALKTPHAFLISKTGEILFAGGVSNSADFSNSSKKYLRNALTEFSKGKPIQEPQARALGCVIKRKSG